MEKVQATKNTKLDGRPTTAEWPVKIWATEEIQDSFKEAAYEWIGNHFGECQMVFAPKRRTAEYTFNYLFGYRWNEIFYLRENGDHLVQKKIRRDQITTITKRRELLNAEIIITYLKDGQEDNLSFPYIPSTYYLYDPFLNWMLGLEKDFLPALAEHDAPRPEKLYHESLAMFNFSLAAYRLGNGFQEYQYRFEKHRKKWMPWKVILEEWLELSMEKGVFKLHSYGYLTECVYTNLHDLYKEDTL